VFLVRSAGKSDLPRGQVCAAYPINTNITGPASIDFSITNVLIPAGGSVQQSVGNILVSSTVVGSSPIVNTITGVTPVNPGSQVFLGAAPLPTSAAIDVTLGMACSNMCTGAGLGGIIYGREHHLFAYQEKETDACPTCRKGIEA
jgi:hypothetical protein